MQVQEQGAVLPAPLLLANVLELAEQLVVNRHTSGDENSSSERPARHAVAAQRSVSCPTAFFTSDSNLVIFPVETGTAMPQPTATSTDNRVAVPAKYPEQTIEQTIDERASVYGNYSNTALIAQDIKFAMAGRYGLAPDMRESLDLIATKISRILSGDPNNVDNWHDIAGYALLIEQRLRKKKDA